MADPGGSTVARTALALNECLLLLVERLEYGLNERNGENHKKYHIEYAALEFHAFLLTLSLTVSLILLPALLMADDKKEPKCLACCVTFVVTVEAIIGSISSLNMMRMK